MNLFLPSCRDLFINFEWFLFNWKLLQSTGSEPGHIWTGIVLDPNKKENKKRQHSDYWRGSILSPLVQCPSQLHQPDPFTGSSLLPPFVGQLLLGSCWWQGLPARCSQVGADPPGGVCVQWCALGSGEPGLLGASGGSCIPVPQLPNGKRQSVWEL